MNISTTSKLTITGYFFVQLYKKTPAAILSLDHSQTPLPDTGALVASLLDQHSDIGTHNRTGLSCVIPDPELSDSNRYNIWAKF